MEAIIAWIIYLGLQFLELCNCFPVTPHSEDGVPSGPELGALAPSLLAALSLLTAVLLLAGCSWCRRIIKKEVVVGQPIPLENSGSGAALETGIHNPLNDIRFPITAAISSQSPRSQLGPGPGPGPDSTPARAPLPHLNLRQVEVDNNQDFEDNNNGPISEQELENIVNNNAENYIVSEYENRNLNLESVRLRAVEVFEQPQTSRNLTPAHASARGDGPTQDVLAEHKDWFDNPNNDFPRNQLQYLQTIGRGWFGRIVEGEAHNLISLSGSTNGNPSPGTSPLHLPHPPNAVTRVAVKILDENVTVTDKCTFLEEARLYRDLRHENLLKFCGRNLTQDPWLILFEYCPLGDLKNFLQSNKSEVTSLSQKGLPLKFQCEIATALEYLHLHNLTHPDVACHSCLVVEGPSARLGDYGDAPRRHPGDFHSVPGQSPPRPLRWLPPETGLNLQSTPEGNMWSLGVLLWESCCWGALPHEGLSHEQVLTEVMRPAGLRLPPPPHYTEYVTYLYNVMQSCWHEDPGQRCASSQVASYLQNIYSNYHLAASQPRESITHDFEARWQSLKPNSIPKVDNGLPLTAMVTSPPHENFYELKFPPSDIIVHDSSPIREHQFVYHNLAISSDTLTGDELSVKAKSDSLTNLHGSFESVLEKNHKKLSSAENPPFSATSESSAFWETSLMENPLALSDTSSDKLLFDSEVSQVAPWLRDVPFTTPEDMSYIKNVSDVISDFDNMLSSEKTSSSESSHQTSPSRDVSGNPKAALESASDATQLSQMFCPEGPEVSRGDSISDLTRCDSDSISGGTLNDVNIDSDIVNSPPHDVPEISNMDSKESYPTLDFRLIKMPETPTYPAGLPIFQIDCEEDVQLFDSLQDSSYTPDPLKDKQYIKTESGEEDSKFQRQCSSGSETEDEIWKKRIELGTLTEKIKLKSKSVTDFMVLTHIDTDFTDMESEETSFTSMEGYGNMFFNMIQKKFKQDSPPKESSLPTEKYLSFPRNYSSTLLSRVESLRPDLDLYRLWKSHRTMAVKSLRLNKSLSDLTESKSVTVKELQMFKRNLDFFLDANNSIQKEVVSKNEDFVKAVGVFDRAKPVFQNELQPADEGDQAQQLIHFSLPGNFSFHLPNKDRMLPSPPDPLGTDLLNVTSEEENLKFSSNFNDINLNLYAGDHLQRSTMEHTAENDPWESTKFMNLPQNYNFDSQIYSDVEPIAISLYDSEINHSTELDLEPSVAAKNFHDNVETENVSTSTPVSNQIIVPINDSVVCQSIDPCTDGVGGHANQSIRSIMQNEILNLTTTLAIAENENNLNIEYSGPLETEQVMEEAQESSQGLASNEHSVAEENNEVDDHRKVDNVSTETNSLLTGTESGIESQLETMDKLSQECTSELTLEQSNAGTQRSDLEPTNDGSLSNDLESGIVSLDHSDPNLASHENCFENDVFNIVDSKPTPNISDINQMFIESESFLPPRFKELAESSVSDDNNVLIHHKLDSDFVVTAGDFPEVKQINVAEQNIAATCDHVVSFDQKIEELETIGNLVMDMGSDDIVTNLFETIKENTVEKTNKGITQTIDEIIAETEFKVMDLNAHNEEKEPVKESTLNADISTALLESEGYKQEETSAETTTKKNNTPEDEESMNRQFLDTAETNAEAQPKEFSGETQLATQRNYFDQSESRDELSQNLDLELQRLDAENEDESNYYSDENNSEPQYVNVGSTSQLEESSSGWFLHPKEGIEDQSKINVASDGIQQNFELAHNFAVSNGSSTESLTENSGSERYTVDAESVEALRNELELKLPLAQKMGQIRHDNITDSLGESRKDWSNDMTDLEMSQRGTESFVEPTVKKMTMMHPEPGTSSGTGCLFSEDALVEEVKSSPQQVRNEVLIHYNMYGVVPLSPIQEESWSEFSEMEKAADKTDTSNSLSLGEQTSNIENILPFDGVCQAVNMQLVSKHEERQHNWSDDETHSDCSNRTFVLNEAGPSNLNRQRSLSADSLDSFDGEHMGLDDDNAPPVAKKKMTPVVSQFPPHSLQTSELLSPFYEEHSHNKSTEEISQNVDNLLENISKTLENASKMSLSSESNEFINQEIPIDGFLNQEIPIDDLLSQEIPLELSLNESDDGSKTYVIEDKKATIKDMSIDFNKKVAELHDDLSNVSKISQPSFISELTSPNDSDVKPSDRSISINLHTKTPSMDSWCSNDTLFNMEENFDDMCSTETLTSPVPRDAFAESQTFTCTADIANVVEKTPLPDLYDSLKCGQALPSNMLPAVEMVMGCPEVIHTGHHGEEADHFFSGFQQDSAKNSPEMPKLLLLNNMEPTIEGASFNLMTNKSEDSLTAESGISILVNSDVKFSAPLDKVLEDSPISAAESGVLTLPTIQLSNSDEVMDISHEDTPQTDKILESLSLSSREGKPPAILDESFIVDSQASVDTNENASISGDRKDDFKSPKPAELRNVPDNRSYGNSFQQLKTAMTSTPTSVDHMQKNGGHPLAEAAESPDNIIDAQFQFLEGIVDSSISYISFKDDAGQNFMTHEKNLAVILPSNPGQTPPLPDISTNAFINIPSIVIEDLDLLADPNSDEFEDIKKHSTGVEDMSGPAFSTIHSSGDLGEKQQLSSDLDMIKNSTGLEDIGSPNFSIIPTTDLDVGLHEIKANKNSTGLEDIGSPNVSAVPTAEMNIGKNSTGLEDIEASNISVITSGIHPSDTPNTTKETQLTGLEDNASQNFSIIPFSETNLDSNSKHDASANLELLQEPRKNSTGLEDIGSPNFSIIPALGINLIDSNISTGPETTQGIKKNSTGLQNISSPNLSMIPSVTKSVDSRVAYSETKTVNPKSNSTGLGDMSSANFSIIQAPGQNSTADKTHNSSGDCKNIPEPSINSLDLYEMSSSSFSDLSFPESTNQVRDWHVNNVTVSFLENERQFNSLTPKGPIFLLENGSLSNDIKSKHETDHTPSLDSFMENVATASQQVSNESFLNGQIGNIINSTGLVNISSPNLSKMQHQIADVNESNFKGSDAYPSSLSYQQSHDLDEYTEYTGLNMGAQNLDRLLFSEVVAKDPPTFETFKETAGEVPQDLTSEAGPYLQQKGNSPLSEIHFSGPSNDDMMSTSFNEMSPVSEHAGAPEEHLGDPARSARTVEDISHIAPERLKDWDSESDDSNCSSTSSGDFVWKEGGKEQLLSVSALLYPSPDFTQKNQGPGSRGVSQSFADIPEEETAGGDAGDGEGDGEEGEGEDDEDEEVEFVPSSWDCRATPTKSALKSPETSQMDNRKRVMFKKQKYQCIYEYPREILSHDDDDMQTLPDYSTYSDWHPFGSGNGSYMAVDFENFLNAHPGDLHQPSSDLLSEDDFYISSSTRPFETYNLISSSSQFFPGQHLSLFSNMKPYGGEASDIDDYDSLPTIPTEYEIQQSTLNNAGTNTDNDHVITKPSFDYVTPDSGTEDITPGSLIDYDFKDSFANNEPFNKNDVTHIDVGTNSRIEDTLTEQEILFNSTNKNGTFGRPFCGTLILPERGSSGSLTPSSPSPSLSGHSSQSSGSTSPLPPPSGLLGGLRHTRDKLKLDLPPSPLAIILTSGKNANKDIKIFDFKNMDSFQSDDLDKTLSESASDVSSTNTLVENTDFKSVDKSSRLLEESSPKFSGKHIHSELCNVDGLDPNSLELDDSKALEVAPFSPISMIGNIIPDRSSLTEGDICSYKSQGEKSPEGETGQFDTSTLQKAVVPMGTESSWRKASLEPVKGEGTLLDSGDEDSGIGSSAYATLERKLDCKEMEPEGSKSTNERHVN